MRCPEKALTPHPGIMTCCAVLTGAIFGSPRHFYRLAAGDEIAAAQMVDGIQLVIIKLPVAVTKGALIRCRRDDLAKQGVILILCGCRRQQATLHPRQTFFLDNRQTQYRARIPLRSISSRDQVLLSTTMAIRAGENSTGIDQAAAMTLRRSILSSRLVMSTVGP